MKRAFRSESGQTATELMMVISVVVIGVVAAAWVFVPTFQQGVQALADDVRSILDNGTVGGIGLARNGSGGPANGTNGTRPDGATGIGNTNIGDGINPNLNGVGSTDQGNNRTEPDLSGLADTGRNSGTVGGVSPVDPGLGNGTVGNHTIDPGHNGTAPPTN